MRQSTKIHSHHQGLPCCLSCRAAVVVPDPHLRVRDHPSAPDLDRPAVAEAEPRGSRQALLVPVYLRKGETFAAGRIFSMGCCPARQQLWC
jgi:hypothetical protein